MEVKLISNTQNIIDVIYTGARTCYNPGSPIDMWEDVSNIDKDKKIKLIDFCISHKHLSVLEHATFNFAIEGITRSCSHQLVRHRLCSFCLSGDTIIKQRSHGENKTIKELFESTQQYNDMRRIRCINENTRELQYDPIKKVVYSGIKPVYEVETEFGYKIKSTMQHRFLTSNGWKQLEEINVGDTVFVNGIPAYQDKEWLKIQYHTLNKSQEEIGLDCGVSKHTIRKWIKIHNLQKEIGSWSLGVEPVNKNRTKYDYAPMAVTSQKMLGNTNAPKLYESNNHNWKGDNITIMGGYNRTHRNNKRVGICSNCGTIGETHLHHMDKNPKNAKKENIMELCPNCHKAIHKREVKEVVIPNKIISIKYIGEVDTYDIEMAGDNHNFIANGFVVHNSQQSQRYVEIKEDRHKFLNDFNEDTYLENTDVINTLDKYFVWDHNNFSQFCLLKECLYRYLFQVQEEETKPEEARQILPNCTKTNIVMSCNLRELIHICNERLCNSAQLEIRQVVQKIKKEVLKENEWLEKYLQPKCVPVGKCTEGSKCCGYITKFTR